jgi:nucleoid-associated protein YgaU
MNLKFSFNNLRRRTLLLFVVVALSAAMLPTAAFASGYGHQGRGWDPGPRQPRGYHRPAQNDDNNHGNNHYNNHDQHNNGNNYNQGGQHDNRPSQCDVTYRVKRGDSLSEIASRYGVSLNQLAKANGIKNTNRIYAGQVLCIPC